MITAVNYIVEYDEEKGIYKIENKDALLCPDCGRLLSGYDTRKRHEAKVIQDVVSGQSDYCPTDDTTIRR